MPKTMPVSGDLTGKFPRALTNENEGVYDYASFDEQYTGKWYTPCAVADGTIGEAIPVYRKRYAKGITDPGGTDTTGNLEALSAIDRVLAWDGWTYDSGTLRSYHLTTEDPTDTTGKTARYGMGLELVPASGQLIYTVGSDVGAATDDWQIWIEYTKDTD